jgi:uncharacterized protein involved in response to NO
VADSNPERERFDEPTARWVLLAFGFRPFFLLAGLAGALGPAVILAVYTGLIDADFGGPVTVWHGHEMIFGFVVVAVAGFLFTALANWTGRAPVRGATLGALVGLWLAGRAAMALAGVLPAALVAMVDLALLPALAVLVLRELIRGRNRRNMPFPVLLMVLFVANLLFHLERLGVAETARAGLYLSVHVIALLIAIVGGRVVPAFTTAALRRAGAAADLSSPPWLERAAIAAVAAVAVAELADPGGVAAGGLALAAALLLAARLSGWRGLASLDQPILWVLHLGYGWLAVGFALKAAADLAGWLPPSAALHALTAGAAGTMILGVMTHAALGHTGRALATPPAIVVAYGLISVGAALRVAEPLLAAPSAMILTASALIWAAGFAIFTVVYWPILTRPRIDGRPG